MRLLSSMRPHRKRSKYNNSEERIENAFIMALGFLESLIPTAQTQPKKSLDYNKLNCFHGFGRRAVQDDLGQSCRDLAHRRTFTAAETGGGRGPRTT